VKLKAVQKMLKSKIDFEKGTILKTLKFRLK